MLNDQIFDEVMKQHSDNSIKNYSDWIERTVEINLTENDFEGMMYYPAGNAFVRPSGPFELCIIPAELFEKCLGAQKVQDYITSNECTVIDELSFNRSEGEDQRILDLMFNY